MLQVPGPKPVDVQALSRAEDRLSFLYLERCTVHRDGNSLTSTDDRGVVHIPSATLGALLLGPGTRVTHQAMMLAAESGATVVWVGEKGVRYYAHGRGLTSSSRLVERQAHLVSNQRSRLAVARRMYAMRFPGEDVGTLTMQQLRGREGARVRNGYRDAAADVGVEWRRRDYDPSDFGASDAINQALSAATTCLYGVVHAVSVALGCAPGLRFVHTGHARAFVYDIADLYKLEIAVPVAFRVAAECEVGDDVGAETRRAMRDAMYAARLLERCAKDIRSLLLSDDEAAEAAGPEGDTVHLWDGSEEKVAGGTSWGSEPW